MNKTTNLILLVLVAAVSVWLEIWLVNKWLDFEPDIASLDESVAGLPVISDEVSLERAVSGAPSRYILEKIPVFGDKMSDTMRIFRGSHLAMAFQPYNFVYYDRRQRREAASHGKNSYGYWERCNFVLNTKPDSVLLFNKFALNWKSADLKASHSSVESADIIDDKKLSYLNSFVLVNIDTKYQLFKLDDGDAVSMVAVVGDGKIDISEVAGSKLVAIGPISELADADSLSEKMKWFGWIAAFSIFGVLALALIVMLTIKFVLKCCGTEL